MVDIDQLVKERDKIQRLVSKHMKRLLSKEQEIKDNCTHLKTKTKPYHVEGGYLNVAEYHTILYCETCEKELDRKITYGSYA